MSPERWEQVKGMVKDKFTVLDERVDTNSDAASGTTEVIEFTGPAGRMRFRWTDEPLKLGSKTFAAKRIGSEVTVVHQYSETERLHRFNVDRWDEPRAAWIELRGESAEFFKFPA